MSVVGVPVAEVTARPRRTGAGERGRSHGPITADRHGREGARSHVISLLAVERLVAFTAPLALYLTLGALLAFKYHSWFGDAQARLANAYYVLYSRDPHLAAIGFVWNPGTSLAELPVLLLKPLFPALSTEAYASVIVSALAMAGAGYQIFRFAEELRIARLTRWLLLAGFVGNPMILYYGSNGMSEPLFILTLVTAVRYLARWIEGAGARSLVVAGFAVGLSYVVRNEAVAAAGLGFLVVAWVTYRRATGPKPVRRMAAMTDAALFISPFALAFIGWALVSWIIVGHPFEQYSSAYGTASQLKLLNLGGTKSGRFWWALKALLLMTPTLPILAVLALSRARRQRDRAVVAVAAITGGIVAFELAAYTFGQIAWALRYLIYSIPLTVLLAACVARPDRGDGIARRPQSPRWMVLVGRRIFAVDNIMAGIVAVSLLLPTVFTTGYAMFTSQYDSVDQQVLSYILWPNSAKGKASPYRRTWIAVNQEAKRLDAMHLGRGALMVDNFNFCIPNLILQSAHPKQFRIPNDQDFVHTLGAPYAAGVRYMLVPSHAGYGAVDALNVEWPSLYDTGAGIANLVGNVKMAGCAQNFRLYKLIPEP